MLYEWKALESWQDVWSNLMQRSFRKLAILFEFLKKITLKKMTIHAGNLQQLMKNQPKYPNPISFLSFRKYSIKQAITDKVNTKAHFHAE